MSDEEERKIPIVDQETVDDSIKNINIEAEDEANDKEELSNEEDSDELDEEDLELIAENTGRKLSQFSKHRDYKRIKRGGRKAPGSQTSSEDEDNNREDEDEDDLELHHKATKKIDTNLENLFDSENEEETTAGIPQDVYEDNLEDYEDDVDDLRDFIEEDVDEENEIAEMYQKDIKKQARSLSSRRTPSLLAKIPRKKGGLNTDKLQEMLEIFGHGETYEYPLPSNKSGNMTKPKAEPSLPELEEALEKEIPGIKIEEAFEPSILADHYVSTTDELIKILDIPERIQLRDGSGTRPALTEDDLRQESVWISNLLAKNQIARPNTGDEYRKGFLSAVASILKLIREDSYEIPFIATHRKELFMDILTLDDLWSIYDLDEKWKIQSEKKSKLRGLLDRVRGEKLKENMTNGFNADEEQLLEMMNQSDLVEEDLEDIHDYIQYKYSKYFIDIVQNKRPLLKRPSMANESLEDSILAEFKEKFGLTAKQYTINLQDNYKRFEPEDCSITPETLAHSFVSGKMPSAAAVLGEAIRLLGKEFGMDPNIRRSLRNVLQAEATLTTRPTLKGKHELETLHPLSKWKYITHKPMSTFVDDEYLEILQAVHLGYITMNVEIVLSEEYMKELTYLVSSESYAKDASYWNPFRVKVLQEMLHEVLVPLFKRRVSRQTEETARRWALKYCQHALLDRLLSAPYRQKSTLNGKTEGADETTARGWSPLNTSGGASGEDTELEPSAKRFMALSFGNGEFSAPTYCSIVDGEGICLENVKFAFLSDRFRKGEDYEALVKLIEKHRPLCIAISGTSLATRNFLMDVKRLTGEKSFTWKEEGFKEPEVLLVDDEVARLAMHSQKYENEFPSSHSLIKYTVSLARRCLDPLPEYATLVNKELSILSLALYPYQDMLDKEALVQALERAFVIVTNLVGLEVNRLMKHRFWQPCLPFICGLGPRKAKALLSALSKAGGVEKRHDLIRKGILSKKIFLNAASFLRIDPSGRYLSKRHGDLDVLDGTRIHPENYELARKMAADALDIDDSADHVGHLGNSGLTTAESSSVHVEELMNNYAYKLNDLLLDEYAKELEKRQGLRKMITLKDIRLELQEPFKDRRVWREPSVDKVFTMLTGESHLTLYPGVVVPIVVTKVMDKFVAVKVESSEGKAKPGLTGAISVKYLRDSFVRDPEEVVQVGQGLLAKVISVNKEKFSLDLTIRPSDLAEEPIERKDLDQYYDRRCELEDTKSSTLSTPTAQPLLHQGPLNTALKNHSNFKLCSRVQAEAHLNDPKRHFGDLIIRPSSKGSGLVVFSWKIAPGIIQHLDVQHVPGHGTSTGHWKLGEEIFEDFDEIIARYIEPLTQSYLELFHHAKYQSLSSGMDETPAVTQVLKGLREAVSNKIHYCLSLSKEFPGKIILAWCPKEKTIVEYITVTPNGLRFRKLFFENGLSDLLNYFKRDWISKQSK